MRTPHKRLSSASIIGNEQAILKPEEVIGQDGNAAAHREIIIAASVDESRYERIDGQLVPRPVPGEVHAQVQANLVLLLREQAKKLGGKALPEWSVTRPETRAWPEPDYLTPDITFALPPIRKAGNGHLLPPAFLAIEVASPHQEDLFRKAQLYAAWGVAHVWIVNPQSRECFEYHGGNQFTWSGMRSEPER